MFLLRILEFFREKMTGRFGRLKLCYLWIYNLLIPGDKRLRAYKDIHKGERCFCIGTAPSLTLEDIEAIKGEYSFSCNSILKLFDKTDWRPTYFLAFDPYFYSLYHEAVDKIDVEQVFYNKTQIPKIGREGIAIKGSPEHLVREYMKNQKKRPFLTLSTELDKKLIIGQSTIHTGMALAAYMGFSEIYLLGVDCDYSGNQHGEHVSDERLTSADLDAREMIKDFNDYKPQFEARGIKVVNCSRGGKLKVFPCIPLEEVLGTKAEGELHV